MAYLDPQENVLPVKNILTRSPKETVWEAWQEKWTCASREECEAKVRQTEIAFKTKEMLKCCSLAA